MGLVVRISTVVSPRSTGLHARKLTSGSPYFLVLHYNIMGRRYIWNDSSNSMQGRVPTGMGLCHLAPITFFCMAFLERIYTRAFRIVCLGLV
jgi:hypothetical protein